jgi:hypothetical protein
MPLVVLSCPKCAYSTKVPDCAAGEELHCPRCGELLQSTSIKSTRIPTWLEDDRKVEKPSDAAPEQAKASDWLADVAKAEKPTPVRSIPVALPICRVLQPELEAAKDSENSVRLDEYPARMKTLKKRASRNRRHLGFIRFLQAARQPFSFFGKGPLERLGAALVLCVPFFFLAFWLCLPQLSSTATIAVSGLVVLFLMTMTSAVVLGKTDAELKEEREELKKELPKLEDRIEDLEQRWHERYQKAQDYQKAQELPRKVDIVSETQQAKVLVSAFCFAAWALALLMWAIGSNATSNPSVGAAVVLGIAGLILFGIAGTGIGTSCPKCRWWWVKSLIEKRLIDKKRAFKTVTRTDQHSGSILKVSTSGNVGAEFGQGTTKRKEQIQVMRHYYDNHFSCDHCKHQWITRTEEDLEDFVVD